MNKEELIKIFSTYLPYYLQILLTKDFVYPWQRTVGKHKTTSSLPQYLKDEIITLDIHLLSEWIVIDENEFKPILYDLSYITKEIEHEGKKVMPYKLLFSHDLPWEPKDVILDEALSFINNEKRLEYSYPYEFWQKLLSMHFNIFNIPADQFINKANLNQ